jgi:hypothetical protein
MKKFLATILAIIYLVTSTGAAVHMHYCMGKIYSVDFVKKDDCSKCGMKATNGCCRDEFKILKVKDHKLIPSEVNFAPSFAVLNNDHYTVKPVFFSDANLTSLNNNSPPDPPGTSICILNCVFRL